MYRTEENTLVFFNETNRIETKITFPYRFCDIRKIQNKIIIVLDIPSLTPLGYIENNNVFCYSETGNFLWQVEPRITPRPEIPATPFGCGYYDEDMEVFTDTDLVGRRYFFDLETGKIEQDTTAIYK